MSQSPAAASRRLANRFPRRTLIVMLERLGEPAAVFHSPELVHERRRLVEVGGVLAGVGEAGLALTTLRCRNVQKMARAYRVQRQ